jgi:hypothetical protein
MVLHNNFVLHLFKRTLISTFSTFKYNFYVDFIVEQEMFRLRTTTQYKPIIPF